MHLGTRSLTLNIDGIPRTADVSGCRITSAELDSAEWAICGPRRQYRLQCTLAQDLTPDSLWDLLWSRDGQLVDVELRPAGGTTPTADQPWFVGTVTITEPEGDLLGGDADTSPSARFIVEIDWPFKAKPTRVNA